MRAETQISKSNWKHTLANCEWICFLFAHTRYDLIIDTLHTAHGLGRMFGALGFGAGFVGLMLN